MEFCPKCKALLLPAIAAGKPVLKCRCGYARKDPSSKEAVMFTEVMGDTPEIPIIDSEANPMPKVEWRCFKCGAKEAYFWSAQLRRGDEAETTFYRCVKCGKTWRRSG